MRKNTFLSLLRSWATVANVLNKSVTTTLDDRRSEKGVTVMSESVNEKGGAVHDSVIGNKLKLVPAAA